MKWRSWHSSAHKIKANGMTDSLTIRRPDDRHVHLRDGAMLEAVVAHTARQFARAIVMPNLSPPVVTVAAAEAYRQRIVAAAHTRVCAHRTTKDATFPGTRFLGNQ